MISYTVVGQVDFNIKNSIDISRGRDKVVISGENGTLNILGPVLTYLNFGDAVAEINEVEFIDLGTSMKSLLSVYFNYIRMYYYSKF